MNKLCKKMDVLSKLQNGTTLMIGGFNKSGAPMTLLETLRTKTDVRGLTTISIDTGAEGTPLMHLLEEGRIRKVIVTFFGLNKVGQRRVNDGSLEYELIPQGTFAERIRCAGAGLGGILTPTGVGTEVEKGKEKIEIDGQPYLLEKPLRADVALICAETADKMGNLHLIGTARNINEVMAKAADYVIVEAKNIVEVGELDPNDVTVPSVYVDAVVWAGEEND